MIPPERPSSNSLPPAVSASPADARGAFADNPLFAGISESALAALEAAAARVRVPGGSTLFEQGDPPEALYVLVRGTLHILVRDDAGAVQSVDYLGPGALVGELGTLLDEPRSATVRAVRDAELIRVPSEVFRHLLAREPALGAAVSRLLGRRLTRTTRQPRVRPAVRAVALLPVDGRPVPDAFLQALFDSLGRTGISAWHMSGATLDALLGPGASAANRQDAGDGRVLELCDRLEADHALVVYEADPAPSAWSARCLRQADLVLLIADAASPPAPGPHEIAALRDRPSAAADLVLLHRGDAAPTGTIAWLEARPPVAHHHVHVARAGSVDRLVRFVTGRARGLVLSGGGARGFAHIGVIRALRDAGVPADVVGGSSMGAIVAAQLASGFDPDELAALNARAFGGSDLRDLTVPAVALRSARSTVKRLRAMFGDRRIEDLPLRYFCLSTDLTTARSCVHDRGPLWLWTRASCAIPGLVPPVASEGRLLVDGGLLNNLPADVMRRRCSGPIIAVNVTPTVDLATDEPETSEMSGWPYLWRRIARRGSGRPFPGIAQILSRTVFVSSVRDAQSQALNSDLFLQPDLEGIGMGDFHAIDRIVEAGYRHAAERLAAWSGAAAGPSAE